MTEDIKKNSRNTDNAPKDLSSQTVAFSHYNNLTAQLPLDPKSGTIVSGGIKEQTKQCLNNIKAIVESIGHVMDDVVKLNIFLRDISDLSAVDEVYTTFFQHDLPTRVTVEVADLPLDGALLQIDALISNGEGTTPQDPVDLIKVSRNTDNAPKDLSSHSVAFSHYNNLTAQLPVHPRTGEIVSEHAKEQVIQCLLNIEAILESIDHVMEDVVKTTVYLTNISDADVVDEAFEEFFPDYVPARTVVIASALPKGAKVQIDTVVSHGDGTPPQLAEDSRFIIKEASNTDNAPQAPYSHTVAFSHYNHISGQLPLNPVTGEIVNGGVAEQTEQCLKNIKAIVESVEHVMDDTVKLNIQLKNSADIEAVNSVYPTFFTGDLPARTIIVVSDIPMGALVQIDAVVSNCEGTPPPQA